MVGHPDHDFVQHKCHKRPHATINSSLMFHMHATLDCIEPIRIGSAALQSKSMPTNLEIEPITFDDLVHKAVVAIAVSIILPSLPFVLFRIFFIFIEHSEPDVIIISPLVPDFAMIGVGCFLANLVAYITFDKLQGFRRSSFGTKGIFFLSFVSVITCWGGYQAFSQGSMDILKTVTDIDTARTVLSYAVPTTVISSVLFFASYLRDQIRQNREI